MTREKPPCKTWDVWIEQLIQEAKDAGEFDHLEGKGKPIPGVEAPYDPDWWVKKLLAREKVSMLPRSWPGSGPRAARTTCARGCRR